MIPVNQDIGVGSVVFYSIETLYVPGSKIMHQVIMEINRGRSHCFVEHVGAAERKCDSLVYKTKIMFIQYNTIQYNTILKTSIAPVSLA